MKHTALAALLCAAAAPALAQNVPMPAMAMALAQSNDSAATIEQVDKLVRQKLGFEPGIIRSMPMGIFEVPMGRDVIYVDGQVNYVFTGNLFRIATRENLTQHRRDQLSMIDIKTLPVDKALTYVKGKGERVIYTFSDPKCDGCARLALSLNQMDNVTIHTFLIPMMESEDLVQRIYCSKDPAKAWSDWVLDKKEPQPKADCGSTRMADNQKLAEQLDITVVPTLFFPDGSRHEGSMSKMAIEGKFAPPCPMEHMHQEHEKQIQKQESKK